MKPSAGLEPATPSYHCGPAIAATPSQTYKTAAQRRIASPWQAVATGTFSTPPVPTGYPAEVVPPASSTTDERGDSNPRPPAVVLCDRPVRVVLSGIELAGSARALRVLETSHPPTIYVPPDSCLLTPGAARPTWCEFKGAARYLDAVVGGRRVESVAWTFGDPAPGYETLRNHVAFYPGRVDEAWLGDERVTAQVGDFYGGWISADLVGPFKGAPGTLGW